jgi:hypothetical protein
MLVDSLVVLKRCFDPFQAVVKLPVLVKYLSDVCQTNSTCLVLQLWSASHRIIGSVQQLKVLDRLFEVWQNFGEVKRSISVLWVIHVFLLISVELVQMPPFGTREVVQDDSCILSRVHTKRGVELLLRADEINPIE